MSPAEAEAEKPTAEADHGPTEEPHLGDQLHAGRSQLSLCEGEGQAGLTGQRQTALYRRNGDVGNIWLLPDEGWKPQKNGSAYLCSLYSDVINLTINYV